jgi:hypothetical protein
MRNKFQLLLFVCTVLACSDDMSNAEVAGGSGQGGSMTRFAIQGNVMYLIDATTLRVFDIHDDQFSEVNSVTVGTGMETIFAKGEYLYMGAMDAMYIYRITNPKIPEFVFRYAHIVSCDPVVVQGNRAYVTLRTGNACNLGSNALEVLDISDPNNPTLIKNYPMNNPHGLAVDGSRLFICEGEHGFKYYDITNELDIRLAASRTDLFAFDVIAQNGLATVTGEDGIFQFKYADTDDQLKLISKIPVERVEL